METVDFCNSLLLRFTRQGVEQAGHEFAVSRFSEERLRRSLFSVLLLGGA